MKEFLKYFLLEKWKLVQDLKEKNQFYMPIFIDQRTKNIVVDYGSLLHFLKEFLVKKYNANREEADDYIYGFFSISAKSTMNIPDAFLVKIIFGEIYRVAIFSDCKLRTFFNQTLVIKGFNKGEYYNFNAIYFSITTLKNLFENDAFLDSFLEWFSNRKVNVVAKTNSERDMLVKSNKTTFKRLFKIFKKTDE